MNLFRSALLVAVLTVATPAFAADNAFVGRWALTLPDGRAGWLGVEQKGEVLAASLLWGGGSVLPVEDVAIEGDVLKLRRTLPRKDSGSSHVISATRKGSELLLTSTMRGPEGRESARESFVGRLIPDLPARPDLATVKFAAPVSLLAGDFAATWTVVDPKAPNGWTLVDGVLSNRVQKKGPRFANLRTHAVFEDFMLNVEVRTLPGSNSGIYLRGVYEIQIAESYGKVPDGHSMGALYTRIVPRVAAERPIGEWQTLRIILVDRHVSVWLNGALIIENQPALGCTGGALTSDEFQPGPLLLQGDHSDIDFRAMTIARVLK